MLSLLEYGRSQGHEVCVIAPAESAIHEACRGRGLRSEAVEFRLSPAAISHLRVLLRDLRPDIVHGMSIYPVAFVRWLRLLPRGRSVGFFAYVSIDPSSTLPVAAKRFRRTLLAMRNAISRLEAPKLDAIFTPSGAVARRLEALGIHGRVVVVSGAIDPEKIESEARCQLDIPAGHPRIGYAGFLEPLKGVDDLITAFARIAPDLPGAVLLVAGEGPEEERLRALSQALGVSDRVFLMGYLNPVAPFLASLDVFASPSHSETLGKSILEAMALGVPCVCTASGGPDEFVTDGENGLMVPRSDPESLGAAILRLLQDTELASRIGERGRATALEARHLRAVTIERVFAEYENAVVGRETDDAT